LFRRSVLTEEGSAVRDFTKSSFSFSWSMSLFGLQQLGNLLMPRDTTRSRSPAAEAFDSVTRAMEGQFGDTLREMFRAGDRLQRGMVDLMFRMLGAQAMNTGSWMPGMTSGCMPCGRSGRPAAAAADWQTGRNYPGASPGWRDVAPPQADPGAAGWQDEPAGWGPIPDPDPDAGARAPTAPYPPTYPGGPP
jgi:hypothetical protein